jgi:taurine dioxygenase
VSGKSVAKTSINIAPLTGSIGGQVTGVKLGLLTDTEFEVIREAFLSHCMLVFPEQYLSTDEHVAFAQRWGPPSVSPFVQYLDDYPCVLPLTNRGKAQSVTENWHYDSTFLAAPPSATILSARDVPVGGDTMWSNQYLAYDTLSDGMKQLLSGVRAEFTGARLAKLAGGDRPIPRSFHPVVRTHPETGRKALFIGRPGDTVPRLENMTELESLPILRFLYDHSVAPDHIYRHRWSNGDVVMWDNRCTMHYAVHDYGDDAVRELHRVSIQGTAPA